MSRSFSSAEQPAVEVASVALKESLASVLHYFQMAAERRNEDREHVHELRISTRRTVAALELFEDFLPRRATRELQAKLAKLRKKAGEVRDLDVFIARFSATQMSSTGSAETATKALIARLEMLREEAQIELKRLYEKWNRGEQLERWATDVLCDVRPRRSQADRCNELFAHFAPRCLRRVGKRFFSAGTDPKSLKRLHAFRIRVKGLRYCLELLQDVLLEKRFKSAYSLLKKLAQRLGDVNDHATAETMLECLLHDAEDQDVIQLLECSLTRERHALGESLVRFKQWWSADRQRRLRKRLKKAAKVAAVTPTEAGPE